MWMQLRLDFFSNGYGPICFFFSDVLVVIFSSKSREKNTSKSYVVIWLVLWNMIFMTFHILGIVAPTVTDSYFSVG